jgi:hypothetical protein
MFLVIDDLAYELIRYPIHVPIPISIINFMEQQNESALRIFTQNVLRDLMRLHYYEWFHTEKDFVIDGFVIRHDKVYPIFSLAKKE